MRTRFLWLLLALSFSVRAAELKFDFGEFPENQTPTNFQSVLAGSGKPGDWRVILEEAPPLMPPLAPQTPVITRRAVVAQLSQDPTDERFPMLIYDGDIFGDFTLTTQFKIVSGGLEQMAGVAFRIQNETNFYVVRASALGNNFRFYKVVNGERGSLIGPETGISKGVWHDLTVQCKGNEIRCSLDGKELIPPLTDNTFASGKIGFWTKSDSVSYFTGTKLTYAPREVLAQILVRDTVKKYPRLAGLKVYVLNDKGEPRLVASNTESKAGEPGGSAEKDVIAQGHIYYGKEKDTVTVTMPMRDQNGEIIAAVRVIMKSFPGQTEQNAVFRATPIVKEMQARVQTLQQLTQ